MYALFRMLRDMKDEITRLCIDLSKKDVALVNAMKRCRLDLFWGNFANSNIRPHQSQSAPIHQGSQA